MLALQYVSRSFKKVIAVDNVSFAVEAGEIVGFLGPNGAGKTTTIKMAAGLLRPDRGRVLICGFDVHKDPTPARSALGYIPDVPALYPRLTGWETLDFIGDAFRMNPAEKVRKAHELVDLLGLEEWMSRQVETYSHGTRQKLAWAATLLHDPKVLLLDEPTVGLDPANARLIKNVILLLKQKGCAILMSSHLLPMVEELADRIVMISRGSLVAEGTLSELREKAMEAGHTGLEEMFLRLTGASEQSGKAAGIVGKGR